MTAVMELLHGIDSYDDDVLIEVQVLCNGRLVSDCAEHTDDVEVVRQLRFALEQIEVRGNVELRESILGRRHLRLRNGLTIDAADQKLRADALLLARGLARSRDRARDLIAEGAVLAAGEIVRKASKMLAIDCDITVT